jgi:hypothetical protein
VIWEVPPATINTTMVSPTAREVASTTPTENVPPVQERERVRGQWQQELDPEMNDRRTGTYGTES